MMLPWQQMTNKNLTARRRQTPSTNQSESRGKTLRLKSDCITAASLDCPVSQAPSSSSLRIEGSDGWILRGSVYPRIHCTCVIKSSVVRWDEVQVPGLHSGSSPVPPSMALDKTPKSRKQTCPPVYRWQSSE